MMHMDNFNFHGHDNLPPEIYPQHGIVLIGSNFFRLVTLSPTK
jgi:hypothetical protein